jgi:hypothetical protein
MNPISARRRSGGADRLVARGGILGLAFPSLASFVQNCTFRIVALAMKPLGARHGSGVTG